MSYLLGIDVGTTRTAAAIARVGGGASEIEAVNLGDRSSAIPSVLYLSDDGSVVVGEAAERRAVTDPDHVVREFKRRIGDPTPVIVAGRPWAPEELSARLARWVVDRVAQREGGPATRIAITHPASWGAHKKELFAGALARHGLQVMFLAEPQAAAMHYATAERVDPGSTIAVYDLGGGTFDAAVVHKDNGGFSLVGRPEGLAQLGGIDFDEAVFTHVVTGMQEAFENLDENDPAVLAAVAAVRRECSEAKEALSSDTDVSISVFMPSARGSVRLHRSEFEAMIRPHVEETVAALRRAVSSAGLSPEQLSAVLLVGGSSRIPLVGELVSEQLGRPVAVDADPKNAIAKGAAVALLPPPAQVPAARTSISGPMAAAAAGAGMLAPGVGNRPDPMHTAPPPRPPSPGLGAAGMGGAAMGGAAMGGAKPPRSPMPPPPPRPQLDVPSYDYNRADYDTDYDPAADYEYRRRDERRSPAFLVSVGGIVAAVAVIAAVFLWRPTQPDAGTTGSESTIPPSSAVDDPPSSAPAPTTTPGRTSSRPAPPPPVPTRPPATTAPPTTQPPVTTTAPPPATTKPPVTTPQKPPTTVPSGGAPAPAAQP